MGGFPRRSTFLKETRKKAGGAFIAVDSGGAFVKTVSEALSFRDLTVTKAGAVIESMNMLGYAAYGIGATDLVLGAAELKKLMKMSRFPWLAANLLGPDNEPFAEPFLIREAEGRRLGFFGLVGEDPEVAEAPAAGEFTVLDPVEAARRAVAELRRRGSDIVVALANLGQDSERALARDVPGIDIMLGGLSRIASAQAARINGALHIQVGSKGMQVGLLTLNKDGRGFRWELHDMDRSVADDPGMMPLLDAYRDALRDKDLAAKGGRAGDGAAPSYRGASSCSHCHLEIFREWVTGSHAQAFSVLRGRRAEYDPECLVCHATGYRFSGGFQGLDRTPHLKGVQCEACHGPGDGHPEVNTVFVSVGEAICRRCHDAENSPEFDFAPYLEQLGGHAAKDAESGRGQ